MSEQNTKAVLDGDHPGHAFRGNGAVTADGQSRSAGSASRRAKKAEKSGGKTEQRKAHAAAFHAHSSALHTTSGITRGYHKKMAKFHAGRAGMRHDSIRLDAIPALDGQEYVGKVSKGGAVIARIDIGGDGKAMVFLGETGTDRVSDGSDRKAFYSQDPETTASYIEDLLKQVAAKWVAPAAKPEPESVEPTPVEAAAPESVAAVEPDAESVVIAEPLEDVESAEVKFLREVNAGVHDALSLDDLLSRIETSVQALQAADQLAGEVETAANAAITRWVELDQKANG